MKVQLFIPCFVDQLYPQTAFNMVKVLEKAGCTVSYNTSQTCCGQPAFNAGFWDEAKSVCTKFIKDFRGTDCIDADTRRSIDPRELVCRYACRRQAGAIGVRAFDCA